MQQKGELEAKESRKYELEARELERQRRGYELDGESQALELPLPESRSLARIPATRQELRGEELARELEARAGVEMRAPE